MAAHIVLGIAGHVDHGKTTLVKALTGIDTDTTAEEKKRGLTIDLGFASFTLPSGQSVGVVDVPGHEKFIKNMVAGLPGIDLILLVIDVNEGVMPQTIEHLDIISLLGIERFLLVLTKADTLDQELLPLAQEEIRKQLQHTPAAKADMVVTDAVTGRGIDTLKQNIQAIVENLPERPKQGLARMHIDRAFSLHGFGTVVTGTLLDGSIQQGDTLYVYPQKQVVKVRQIQVYGKTVKEAGPGQRTALNIPNIPVETVTRGHLLSASSTLIPTWMVDVKVHCLKHTNTAIKLWDRLRLLIGTTEVIVRAVPLGTDEILPGEEGFLQLRMETTQVVASLYDRFILRTFSPLETIAGGEVLDAAPQKHRRFKEAILANLKAKEQRTPIDVVADCVEQYPTVIAEMEDIISLTKLAKPVVELAVKQLLESHILIETPLGYMHDKIFKMWLRKAEQLLAQYHHDYPLRQGMALSEFRARLAPSLLGKYRTVLVEQFVAVGACRIENDIVAATNFHVHFTKKQERTKAAILRVLENNRFTVTAVADITEKYTEGQVVLDALRKESVIFLAPDRFIGRTYYEQAVTMTCSYLQQHGKIDIQTFRNMTQSSRKSTFLLLEYMDSQHITKRVGNYRVLRNPVSVEACHE